MSCPICAGIFLKPFSFRCRPAKEWMNLIERISDFVARGTISVELRVPAARADLLARLHRDGTVRDVRYEHDFTHVTATIPTRSLEVFAPFLPTEEFTAEDTEIAETAME